MDRWYHIERKHHAPRPVTLAWLRWAFALWRGSLERKAWARCGASVVAEHTLWALQSLVAARGLSSCGAYCPVARGIFPDQGSNRDPCIGRIVNSMGHQEVPGAMIPGIREKIDFVSKLSSLPFLVLFAPAASYFLHGPPSWMSSRLTAASHALLQSERR